MSNQKACSSASSDLVESMLLARSSTEELDMMGVEAHVVSEPAYSNSEELVEVMTHDMASSLKSPVLLSKPCWFSIWSGRPGWWRSAHNGSVASVSGRFIEGLRSTRGGVSRVSPGTLPQTLPSLPPSRGLVLSAAFLLPWFSWRHLWLNLAGLKVMENQKINNSW